MPRFVHESGPRFHLLNDAENEGKYLIPHTLCANTVPVRPQKQRATPVHFLSAGEGVSGQKVREPKKIDGIFRGGELHPVKGPTDRRFDQNF